MQQVFIKSQCIKHTILWACSSVEIEDSIQNGFEGKIIQEQKSPVKVTVDYSGYLLREGEQT